MPFILKSIAFSIPRLILILLMAGIYLPAFPEVFSENGVFRISAKVNAVLKESPMFQISDSPLKSPDNQRWQYFDNRTQLTGSRGLFRNGHIWIRLVIDNTAGIEQDVAIRLVSHIIELNIYYEKMPGEWDYLKIGSGYPGNLSSSSFYEVVPFRLKPGSNVLYFQQVASQNKWPLVNIDFIDPEEWGDDRGEYLEVMEGFNFMLVAFMYVILFQLGYVGVQLYYHRRKEYVDYLVYLFLIGCYFYIRYALSFRVDFFLHYFSGVATLLNDILLFLPYLFYFRFSRHFIEMKEKFPEKNNQIVKVEFFILAMVVVMAVISIISGQKLTGPVAFGVLIPLFFYTIYLFRFFYKNRDLIIRFILLGSICAATGHFFAMLLSGIPGLMETTGISPFYLTISGLVLEMFFFNTGLGYKAKYEQDEKMKLQLEYYKQIEKNRVVHDRLQQMRDSIASDLHDDVGSTLSSIAIYSQLASKTLTEKPEEAKGILVKIQNSTQRMMESMSDIVWAIHSRNDPGIDLFKRMQQFGSEYLSLSDIRFEMTVDDDADKLSFTMEAKRNMLLLFKEIIHNAAKYSKAKTITCGVEVTSDLVLINISDDGIGFDVSSVKKGHGLPGLETRSSELGGTISVISGSNGTTVSLSLPLSKICD